MTSTILRAALAALLLSACQHGTQPSTTPTPAPPPAPPQQPDPFAPQCEDGAGGGTLGALPAQTYVVDADSNADFTSPPVIDHGMALLCFQIVMANTGTPVGVIEIQGSLDGINYAALYLDANRVYGANFEAFSGGTQVSVSSPAGTVNVQACLANPLSYTRVFWDRSSGGAADTIDIFTHALTN